MKFPLNKILYSDGMGWHLGGVPTDVDFKVLRIDETGIWLKGKEYGSKPYGVGPIYILCRTIIDDYDEELKKVYEKTKSQLFKYLKRKRKERKKDKEKERLYKELRLYLIKTNK